MCVHILVFYIICLLTYIHVKIFVRVKQKILLCIPRRHNSFCQLCRLDYFAINAIANLFVHEKLKISDASSEPSPTSKMELFVNLVYVLELLTISAKYSVWDVRLGSEYVSASYFPELIYFLGKVSPEKIGRIKQCLVKPCWRNYWFYQKIDYIISLNNKIKWLKFLFTSLLRAKRSKHLFY